MKRLAVVLFLLATLLSAGEPGWQGTWSAVIGTGGPVFAGTWNAAPGQSPNTVGGAWSLRDPNGAELATGTWAAGKQGKLWKGTWQARRSSGQVYDGIWKAQAPLSGAALFSAMFESALSQAVSGSWQMGSLGGAWTIRAYAQK